MAGYPRFQGDCDNNGPGHVADIVGHAAAIGLHPACSREIILAHSLAADLIGSDIASAQTLGAAQAISAGSVLVVRDQSGISGVLATLLLRASGREAMEAGRFDGVGLDLSMIARSGEAPAAFYAWGCAARSREAARVVVSAAAGLTRLFRAIPRFARAATVAGARTLTVSMGYLPVSGVADLYWLPPEVAS